MYILGLATDYDGTLAHDSRVDDATLAAMKRFKASGRKLILVTGRETPDLERVFPHVAVFDRVVAENGGVLVDPAGGWRRPLAPPPPERLVAALREKGVTPLSVGQTIVATWEPHEETVLRAIRDLGLELQIIFNKGAVMVLPAGVNKASGFAAALDDLGLSAHNVAAVGDAENDHAFLRASGFAVAVANALPMLKAGADLVTEARQGAGVVELIEAILARDVDAFAVPERERIEIGVEGEDRVTLSPAGGAVLIAGASGGGKSTTAAALAEQIVGQGFQICVFDPEGDHVDLAGTVALGDPQTAPRAQAVLDQLRSPDVNVVVNLLALDAADRPALFSGIMAQLAALRAETGRPHWILIDEAHHLLPCERPAHALALPQRWPGAILLTVDPGCVSPSALAAVENLFALGAEAESVLRAFCAAVGEAPPSVPAAASPGQALHWRRGGGARLVSLRAPQKKIERHVRKYAEGELGPDKSFFFRGPRGALNLRAQNLTVFLQLAEGVDDETWLHHLRRHDYSAWARGAIKDDALADEIAAAEDAGKNDAKTSRASVKAAIERRYTAPAVARGRRPA